jgi:hypothetical protein
MAIIVPAKKTLFGVKCHSCDWHNYTLFALTVPNSPAKTAQFTFDENGIFFQLRHLNAIGTVVAGSKTCWSKSKRNIRQHA